MVRKKGFPEEGETVIVTVKDITPYSALCSLDEYPKKEGMIHVSEVSGKWIRDIKKFVKKGKKYPARVLKVDESKGHINLSLKRLSKKNKEKKLQEFKNEERAEKILEDLGKKYKMNLDEAYEKIGFDLQDKFGTMFKAFEEGFQSPELLVRRGVDKKLAESIHEIAKDSIQKKKVKLKAVLEIKSFSGDGIVKVKDLLKTIEKGGKFKIKYISAPNYGLEILTDNPKLDKKKLKNYLSDSMEKFKDGEGSFKIVGDK
jgi:translation initiation factor 2 subunit 1